LFEQAQNLEYLNLSGTTLPGLGDFIELENLTHLFLNDVIFTDGLFNASQNIIQQDLTQLLRNNRRITHLGLNGIELSDPQVLFDELLGGQLLFDTVSLELSDAGVEFLPAFFPNQFENLEVLDLSDNPLNFSGSQGSLFELFLQAQKLEYLNLSGTTLPGLGEFVELEGLTHLLLNDVTFGGGPFEASQNIIQQDLTQLLRNNRRVTHLGLNGVELSDPRVFFDELLGGQLLFDTVSLELSNAGVEFLPVFSPNQFRSLELLDLSNNPINFEASQGSLFEVFQQAQRLEYLNLSGTTLPGLGELIELEGLTHLLLNDVRFGSGSFDITPNIIQQDLTQLLRNNRRVTHLGLNGIELSNSRVFFDELIGGQLLFDIVSLELSDAGIEFLPVFFPNQFSNLEVLDLSDNPINLSASQSSLLEVFEQAQSLQYLNLSNINLLDLNELLSLRSLRSLILNSDEPVNYSTQTLNEILLNNQYLTDLGLNGIQLQTNLSSILNTIADSAVVNLAIANIGADEIVLPIFLIERLESLDISSNNLTELVNLEFAEQLESLILNDNAIVDIAGLLVDLPSLDALSLLNNEAIACDDLDILVEHFGGNVQVINPENCGVVSGDVIDSAALSAIVNLVLQDE